MLHGQSKCACDDVSPFGCLGDPTSCPSSLSPKFSLRVAVAAQWLRHEQSVTNSLQVSSLPPMQERFRSEVQETRWPVMVSQGDLVSNHTGTASCQTSNSLAHPAPHVTSFSEADTVHRIGSSLLRGVFAACGVEQCAKSFQARQEDRGAKMFSDAVQSTTTFKTVTASNHP